MWSLGKVLKTPEVVRVYIGSFWDQPYQYDENKKLFEAEQNDLLKDLHSLPKSNAMRRINELVKRARLAKVHAYIVSHLRGEMPAVFGKEKKQARLIEDLNLEFNKIHRLYQLPPGDFPDLNRFRERLKLYDFTKFPKLNQKMIESMDQVLGEDLPRLSKLFPQGQSSPSQVPASLNPFDDDSDDLIPASSREKSREIFESLNPEKGKLSGGVVRSLLMESNLPKEVLSKIWNLSDQDKDGHLTLEEFTIASWLVDRSLAGEGLPDELPKALQIIPSQQFRVPERQETRTE